MDKIAFFLPTRKGSERVKNKNTRPFAGMDGGLIENKIRQLLGTKLIDEIILSTNDEKCMEVAQRYASDKRLRIIPRPDELCQFPTTDSISTSTNHLQYQQKFWYSCSELVHFLFSLARKRQISHFCSYCSHFYRKE